MQTIAKQPWKDKDEGEELSPSEFKTYSIAKLIRTVNYWNKGR